MTGTITKEQLQRVTSGMSDQEKVVAVRKLLDKGYQVEGVSSSSSSQSSTAPAGQLASVLDHIPTQQQEQPSSSPLGAVGDFANTIGKGATDLVTGALKGIGSTVTGASELGYKLFKPAASGIASLWGGKIQDMEPVYQNLREGILKPQNTLQEVGFGGEQLGEFLIPWSKLAKVGKVTETAAKLPALLSEGGKAEKAVEVASKVPALLGAGAKTGETVSAVSKSSKTLSGLLKLGKTAAKEAAQAGAITSVQTGGDVGQTAATAGIAGALPVVGAALTKLLPSRLINSLIKPATKEFRFGKNPGLAVAQEGIKAHSLEDLASKVFSKKEEVGKMLGNTVKKFANTGTVDAEKMILQEAGKAAQKMTDPQAAQQLQNAMDRIFHTFKYEQGNLVKTGFKDLTKLNAEELHGIQKTIGDLTKWTGSPYEKEVNQTLSKIYNKLGKELDTLAPGAKSLQRRYANLLGAQKALENRLATASRLNLIGATPLLGGTVGALQGRTPEERIKNALLYALGTKLGGSTLVKTNLASAFAKPLSKAAIQSTAGLARLLFGGLASPQNSGVEQ